MEVGIWQANSQIVVKIIGNLSRSRLSKSWQCGNSLKNSHYCLL